LRLPGRLLLAAALAGLVFAVASALAATGDLTPKGCIMDNDTGFDACATTADGLNGLVSVTISGDGRSVYVGAKDDFALASFKRNRSTGALKYRGCTASAGTNLDTCAKHAKGIVEPFGLVLSPDDRYLYVASRGGTVAILKRDTTTGALKSKGCVQDENTGLGCAKEQQGLGGAIAIAMSADGRSIYVSGGNDDAITHFQRNRKTGALRPRGCVADNDTGPVGCSKSTDGLGHAQGIAVSPDGRSVYAASFSDNALTRFARNLKTGALKPKGCVEDEDAGPDDCSATAAGLEGAEGVASPDKRSVYVAADVDQAVVQFHRNKTSGALTPKGCIDDVDTGPDTCAQTATGLNELNSITIGPEGTTAYATGEFDNAISIFERNSSTGHLTPRGCVADNDANPQGCLQTADGMFTTDGVAISPNGKSLYSVAYQDDSIARFKRTP
jgi:6-phosphogluconolactonase (cycloisomerase 2 family)